MSGAPFGACSGFRAGRIMKQSERLMSLDALRGFDMLFIMGFASLVVAVCGLWPSAVTDAAAASMSHVAWDGFAHHDTIFPLFLFIAGVSFPYSVAKQRAGGMSEGRIYAKIVRRGLTLVVLGMVYNGLFKLDFENLRIASVLGRIGPLTFEGNLAGYIDRQFLPGKLIYGSFDPEGLLSTVPAVVTAMLGMFTGEFVRRGDIRGGRKTLWMAAAAAALLAAGLAFSGVLPVNKKLWSSTFVCVVGAYSLGMFALFYYLIDVRGWRRWTLFFRVVGLNSITIYLAQRIVGFGRISDFFLGGIASKCPEAVAAVISSAGYVAVCWLFLYFLYRKNVFLKV